MTANMEKPIKRILINVLFITRGTLRKPPILIIFSAYIFVNLYRITYFASQFTTLKTAADGNSRINVHGIGRFHRFQLKELHLPYGEVDDLREGKSCIYKYSLTIWTRYFETSNPWICQQCHRGRCKRLKRRGRCHAFHKHVTDQTPRVSTRYSPFTREKSATATFYHDGHGSYANHNIPICGATLTRPCFNLTKCNKSEPLKIFSYGGNTDPQLDFATKQQPDVIQKVENADEACLLVVGLNAFQSLDDLIQSEHWNNGENHYIYQSSIMFGSHGDRPFNDKTINDRNINFGLAAMSPWSSDDAYIREGFDTPVGLYPRWKKEEKYNNLDLHRSRRYLVSFKGNIYPDEQRSWQHRWIASEYWDNDDDVHIDTTCEYSRNFFGALRVHNKYDNPDDSDYEQLLLNSTFFFCPGGGGTNSFRFPEALQGGAIPVVTGDFLPPFHPEVDWSGCIVRVSEARVVDLPRILREISEDEIHLRQLKCSSLLDSIFGKPIDSRQHFAVAMQLWNIRIKNALQRIEDLSGLTR